ncbi:hypothetical protein ACIA8I_34505 [Streptomyces rishiriensis]|uniref:hypothetical protein n=1 Tax=Streptomyces rishiriensis TaxID=68264 RepID=UPI0037B87B0B
MRDFGQPASSVGRRTVLLAVGGMAFGAAGCSGDLLRVTAAESPGNPSGLPRATPWHPSPDDVDPQVKLRAVQLIVALGSWRTGEQGAAAARRRVSALGLDPGLVGQAGPLLASADEAVLRVVDAGAHGEGENPAQEVP